ncbi:MAG: efflux RND transporter periplasmic adaptor subunit [Oscillospiraceae bacterium]|nr:efflux RND transporter periplasmic adaptor subunit [Oscillospiraceae bacterium]
MRKTKSEIRGNEESIRSVAAEVGEFLEGENRESPKTPRKQWVRWTAAGTAFCLLVGVAACAMIKHHRTELRYIRETVERRDLTRSVRVTGAVRPAESLELTAQVSGAVLEAPFAEGQTVEKGAVLYVIDSTEAERDLERAKNTQQRAQDSYHELQKAVANCKIKAPNTGTVTSLRVGVGDRVEAGAQIGSVSDRSVAYLNLPFASQDAAKFTVGQAATVVVGGNSFSGAVESIFTLEETGVGGVPVRRVRIKLTNPQGVSNATEATATVGGVNCLAGAKFTFPNDKLIIAGASGKIQSVKIKEGNTIGKNAVVAVIDDSELQDKLKSAKTTLDESTLALEEAQKRLEQYRITAPISGTLVEKKLNAGDVLDHTTGASVAIIYDLSRLNLTVNIEERNIKQVAVGQNVRITTPSLEGKSFLGKVTKVGINGTAQNETTVYPVTVSVDQGSELLPGMNVNADILVMEHTGVLAVPAKAISSDGTVLVSKESESGKHSVGKAEISGFVRVPVECGETDGEFVEITGGLSEGDLIAFDPTLAS